uniref:FTH domain-containing protein n=1 Tax=Caenorhabditis tropicalis TaxID=1561998 RepID=A0A1I7UYM5_9PELO
MTTVMNSLDHFVPGMLKTVVLAYDGYSISLATDTDQWNGLEEFYTNSCFPDFPSVWPRSLHLKIAGFGIREPVDKDEVIRMKNDLLQHPEIRERQITVFMTEDELDLLNDTIGTYNILGTENPIWKRFPYNETKHLMMCVRPMRVLEDDDIEVNVLFRGPNYQDGEMAKAIEETEKMVKWRNEISEKFSG